MARKLGPFARINCAQQLDERTRAARLAKKTRRDLVAHVGGSPSVGQSMLIEQAVQLRLRLHAMDLAFAETGHQSAHASREYLAWSNSLRRLIAALGVKGAGRRAPSLAEHKAARAAAAAEGGAGTA